MKYGSYIILIFLFSACQKEDVGTERFINEIINNTQYDVSIRSYTGNRFLKVLDISSMDMFFQDTISYDLGTNYDSSFLLYNHVNVPADSCVIEFSDGKVLSFVCKIFKNPPGPCPFDDLSLLNGGWNKEPVSENKKQRVFKSTFEITRIHYDAAE